MFRCDGLDTEENLEAILDCLSDPACTVSTLLLEPHEYDVDWIGLSKLLLKAPSITNLKLLSCEELATEAEAQALSELMKAHPSLTSFDCRASSLRGIAAKTLADAVVQRATEGRLQAFADAIPVGELLTDKSIPSGALFKLSPDVNISADDEEPCFSIVEAHVLAACLQASQRILRVGVQSQRLAGSVTPDWDADDEDLEPPCDEGLLAIADALLCNRTLKELSLGGAFTSLTAARRLAAAVLASPSLETFSTMPLQALRCDETASLNGTEPRWCLTEVLVLASLAPSLTRLTSLTMNASSYAGSFLGNDGGSALIELLQTGHLKTLDIRGASRSITAERAQRDLANAVLRSKTLSTFGGIPLCGTPTVVNLSNDPQVSLYSCETFCSNVELHVLADVVSPSGIRFCRTIKSLGLRFNQLDDGAATIIENLLAKAPHVRAVDLLLNCFSEQVVQRLRSRFTPLPENYLEYLGSDLALKRGCFPSFLPSCSDTKGMACTVLEGLEDAIANVGQDDVEERAKLFHLLRAFLDANPTMRTIVDLPPDLDPFGHEECAGGLALRSLCVIADQPANAYSLELPPGPASAFDQHKSFLHARDLVFLACEVHNLTTLDLSGHGQILGHSHAPKPVGCVALLHALVGSRVTTLSLARVNLTHSETCIEFLSSLLLPESRGFDLDADEACPITGLCPLVGPRWRLKDSTGTSGADACKHKLISEVGYNTLTEEQKRQYESAPQPYEHNYHSSEAAKVFVFGRRMLPATWTGEPLQTVERIDTRVSFGESTTGWMSMIRRQLEPPGRNLPGMPPLISDSDFWWQRPGGAPPMKLETTVSFPGGMHSQYPSLYAMGAKSGDVFIVTDKGSAPPARIASPAPAPDDGAKPLCSQLQLKKLDISENRIPSHLLTLLKERAKLWAPEMELVM